jgi:hypothetical protein
MSQQNADLRLNPEKNRVYRLKSVSEQTISQTINGNQQTTESRVEYSISLKMLDSTPEFIVAEVRFDTIMNNTNTMGKVSAVSSAAGGDIKSSVAEDVMSYVMSRLCSNAIFIKIDHSGKPLEVVNAKMLSDMILRDTASITLDEPLAAAVKGQIAATVGSENLKTMIGGFTWYLPGKQVAAGDVWVTDEQVNSGGMMLAVTTTSRIESLTGNKAAITAESKIKAVENAAPMKSGGATITYDNLTGLNKSNMVVDTRTGLIIENLTKTRISGNLGVSAPGFSMQMPMDINGETRVTALQ